MSTNQPAIVFLSIVMFLLLLVPALSAAGMFGFVVQELEADDDPSLLVRRITFAWAKTPLHQLSVFLMLGLSIYHLFILYRGGRSKHSRFNDRTIDANLVAREGIYFARRAALDRAVFNFCSVLSDQFRIPFNFASLRNMLSYWRRY